jgi:shikimate 5-dehydrogenase
MEFPTSDYVQLGLGGAAIAALVALARGFFRMNREILKNNRETTEYVVEQFTNHFSSVASQLESVSKSLTTLTEVQRQLVDEIKQDRRGSAPAAPQSKAKPKAPAPGGFGSLRVPPVV